MKMHLLILLFFFTLQAALAGDGEGSGGDPVLQHYVEAKSWAANYLSHIQVEWLEDSPEEVKEFWKTYSSEIKADLKKTTLSLRDSNTNGFCLQTSDVAEAPIYIGRAQCPETLSLEKTARLIIGDVAHHFQKDDFFAAQFGVAMLAAYERGVPLEGKWYLVSPPKNAEFPYFSLSRFQKLLQLNAEVPVDTSEGRTTVTFNKYATVWNKQTGYARFDSSFRTEPRPPKASKGCLFPVTVEVFSALSGATASVKVSLPDKLNMKTCESTRVARLFDFSRIYIKPHQYDPPFAWPLEGYFVPLSKTPIHTEFLYEK